MRWSVSLALSAVLLAAAPSHAETGAAEKARAEQLFMDAKQLMDQKNYAAACPKLEESLRLDPAEGTRLRLALCYELEGKLASAWVLFREGLARAQKANDADRAAFANEHIAAIVPKLSKVTIVVPASARVPGLEVQWDGRTLGEGEWGSSFPIDPGTHDVSAQAPGRRTWSSKVEVTGTAVKRDVVIPDLETTATTTPLPAPAPAASPATATADRSKPTAAFVLAGTGLALIGGGLVAHYIAIGAQSDRRDHCAAQLHCIGVGDDYNITKMRSWEAVQWSALGLGAVSLGIGIVLYVRAPSHAETGSGFHITRVGTSGDARTAGLRIEGTF